MAAPPGETVGIVGFFVGHSTGVIMQAGGTVHATSIFDGWGYGRLLDVTDPANIVELGQFVSPNVMTNPPPPGFFTAHNVMVRDSTAFWAWYADGIRVYDFQHCQAGDPEGSCQPKEVGFFPIGLGTDFWGVYLHDHPNGQTHILGSDRDLGLGIFEPPYTIPYYGP